MLELFVISVWKSRGDEEFTRIKPVPTEQAAVTLAEHYRELSKHSSTKLEEVILVQGKRL